MTWDVDSRLEGNELLVIVRPLLKIFGGPFDGFALLSVEKLLAISADYAETWNASPADESEAPRPKKRKKSRQNGRRNKQELERIFDDDEHGYAQKYEGEEQPIEDDVEQDERGCENTERDALSVPDFLIASWTGYSCVDSPYLLVEVIIRPKAPGIHLEAVGVDFAALERPGRACPKWKKSQYKGLPCSVICALDCRSFAYESTPAAPAGVLPDDVLDRMLGMPFDFVPRDLRKPIDQALDRTRRLGRIQSAEAAAAAMGPGSNEADRSARLRILRQLRDICFDRALAVLGLHFDSGVVADTLKMYRARFGPDGSRALLAGFLQNPLAFFMPDGYAHALVAERLRESAGRSESALDLPPMPMCDWQKFRIYGPFFEPSGANRQDFNAPILSWERYVSLLIGEDAPMALRMIKATAEMSHSCRTWGHTASIVEDPVADEGQQEPAEDQHPEDAQVMRDARQKKDAKALAEAEDQGYLYSLVRAGGERKYCIPARLADEVKLARALQSCLEEHARLGTTIEDTVARGRGSGGGDTAGLRFWVEACLAEAGRQEETPCIFSCNAEHAEFLQHITGSLIVHTWRDAAAEAAKTRALDERSLVMVDRPERMTSKELATIIGAFFQVTDSRARLAIRREEVGLPKGPGDCTQALELLPLLELGGSVRRAYETSDPDEVTADSDLDLTIKTSCAVERELLARCDDKSFQFMEVGKMTSVVPDCHVVFVVPGSQFIDPRTSVPFEDVECMGTGPRTWSKERLPDRTFPSVTKDPLFMAAASFACKLSGDTPGRCNLRAQICCNMKDSAVRALSKELLALLDKNRADKAPPLSFTSGDKILLADIDQWAQVIVPHGSDKSASPLRSGVIDLACSAENKALDLKTSERCPIRYKPRIDHRECCARESADTVVLSNHDPNFGILVNIKNYRRPPCAVDVALYIVDDYTTLDDLRTLAASCSGIMYVFAWSRNDILSALSKGLTRVRTTSFPECFSMISPS